jgi:hypothetical protein
MNKLPENNKDTIQSTIHIIKALTTPVVAIIALIQGFNVLHMILSGEAKASENIQIYIIGFISGSVLGFVLTYYFGNSFSSHNDPKQYKK